MNEEEAYKNAKNKFLQTPVGVRVKLTRLEVLALDRNASARQINWKPNDDGTFSPNPNLESHECLELLIDQMDE